MKFTKSSFLFNFRPLRFLATAFLCTFIFFASAVPAFAATSSPQQGEASLSGIQAKTDKMAKSDPPGLKETQAEARKGINEVQGDADKEKMVTPESANATSVEEQVKEGYRKVFGN